MVQQRLLEPQDPLGENTGVLLCSQVGAENNHVGVNRSGRVNASSVVRDNSSMLEIVENAGVLDWAVGPVVLA